MPESSANVCVCVGGGATLQRKQYLDLNISLIFSPNTEFCIYSAITSIWDT